MMQKIKKYNMKYIITLVIFISIIFFFICGCVLGKKGNNNSNEYNVNTNVYAKSNIINNASTIDNVLENLDVSFESYSVKNLAINELALFDSNKIDYKKRYAYDSLDYFYEYDLFNDIIKNSNDKAYITDNQYLNEICKKTLIICDECFKKNEINSSNYNIEYIDYKNANDESNNIFNLRDIVLFLEDKNLSNVENIVIINSYNDDYNKNDNIVNDYKKLLNYIYGKNDSIKTYFTQLIPLNDKYDGKLYLEINEKLQNSLEGLMIPIIHVIKLAYLSNNIQFENILAYIQFYVKFVKMSEEEFASKKNTINIDNNNVNNNEVFLTFDDGSCEYTIELLNVLNKYNVKATFFVTNQHPFYNYLFKDIVNNGHSIGAHTYSHKYNIYKSKETYFDDLYKIECIIKKETGQFTKLIRFPGGSNNSTSKKYNKNIMKELINDVEDLGYVYYDWNVSSGDGANISSEQTLNNAMVGVTKDLPKFVVLFHDTKINSVRIIEPYIQYLIATNHKILPLKEDSFICHMSFNN